MNDKDALTLLAAILRQCIRPADAEDCDACMEVLQQREVVRNLAPLATGSDQCPWHAGYENGWRLAAKAVEEALS